MKIISIISVIILLWVTILFSQQSPTLESLQSEISRLIQSAKNAVVTVTASSSHSYTVERDNGLFSLFRSGSEQREDKFWTVGSGIIYNAEGYIITRASILADFDEIKVTFCDGTSAAAEYIGTDEMTGLALLKIDGKNLEGPKFGNSDRLPLYSMVLVLGNSMGLSPFATFGLINGFTEEGRMILSVSINPGNVGGAVFNLKGEIIGIISAQIEPQISAGGSGLLDYSSSLAIPINQVITTINNVIKFHHQQMKWLGVELDADSLRSNKLIVKRVYPGSPAARVGLKPGDHLVKFNEVTLTNPEILKAQIGQTAPGTSVSINFIRQQRALKVFPNIERVWPEGFNVNKPRHFSLNLNSDATRSPINAPIIISPESFQQIHSKMIQMEQEIRSLKNQINK
ncbi:MAG: trypsin-like peptidase domain-containing protein [candidate division KSB1 bacterium]|nr:trypsin-like peptidase domain-containing protein [candidate division KSB1 bacterium]MDZ7335121.1 trypsin-like peptidase domain-containing protein [candidate division KSB1 bacterium]MDZ7356616.1 trypsin-like peptidase domain-containing protein [candidate division KSB1 bacterium]MDZ7376165.1 trypsin-like peptidase domain-containing protein [candidate division KSB1 bacterium]MDZ7398970.1 trypsin-like peptidase domain-containing protein [candidate division KSB1 bacterium]